MLAQPGKQVFPASSGKGGGMSPIMMALLGLLAAGSSRLTASAFECLVSDSPANPASP